MYVCMNGETSVSSFSKFCVKLDKAGSDAVHILMIACGGGHESTKDCDHSRSAIHIQQQRRLVEA